MVDIHQSLRGTLENWLNAHYMVDIHYWSIEWQHSHIVAIAHFESSVDIHSNNNNNNNFFGLEISNWWMVINIWYHN